MDRNNYLVSVIIPTKNRQEYCIKAIEQISELGNPDVQICIQDNSDSDNLKYLIQKLSVQNIVYNYHKGVLSFVDNFSEAISLAEGYYVCMIGDDDGVIDNIVNLARWGQENEVDAIVPDLSSVYFWPSQKPIKKNGEKGYLTVVKNDRRKRKASPSSLFNLMDNAFQDYQYFEVPRLYHGLVYRERLEDVKRKTGSYFRGLTPDIYISVALSLVCKTVFRVHEPFTVSGICPKSGSADSATGRHTGDLKDAPHFRGHSNYVWDDMIPYFYSVETIWAETALHAIKDMGRDDLLRKFNTTKLEAILYNNYKGFRNVIFEHAKTIGISRIKIIIFSWWIRITKKYFKIINYFSRGVNNVCRFTNIVDIKEAVNKTKVIINITTVSSK